MKAPFVSDVEISRITDDIVSVETAFSWCKIDGYSENHPEFILVKSLVLSAEQDIEEYLNRTIRKGVFEFRFSCFRDFDVSKYPCQSIDSVKYYDGTAYVDLPSENYEKFKYSNDGVLIKYRGVLPTLPDRLDAVKIQVTCGYDIEKLPEYIKLAMQLMVGEWYDNRANGKKEFPTVTEGILRKHRMMRV